ncbi:MAG: DnaB-like helicase N-terminal domain-containing protein, partial [Pseudomonadota bacterium]
MSEDNNKNLDNNLARSLPANILAEQMLLGSILTNNEHYNKVSDFLQVDHFYEPVHRRIFEAVTIFIDRGMLANLVTLKNHFDQDPALNAMNQSDYL